MSYHHLTLEERKKLWKLWQKKYGVREIARILGRNASTISRELKRNMSWNKQYPVYRPITAHKKYIERKSQPRSGKFENKVLCEYVQSKLLLTWSPEQVAGRLPLDHPDNPEMRISHTTIYRWLRQERLEQAAQIRLRHEGHRHGETRGKGKFSGIRTLRQRGREIQRRTRIGDWELDTILSAAHSSTAGLLTLCDRKSRYCVITLLQRCQSNRHVFRALASIAQRYPCHSFTADQGTEFACFPRVEKELGIPMYFCSPSSPWQKGSVENLNGLIRESFPRGTNFAEVSEEDVQHVMFLLNNRPRKCLNWRTPAEVFE